MDRLEFFKLAATGCAGLFAGGAVFVNVCEDPARSTLDIVPRRKQWAESYNRAKFWQGGLVSAGTLPALAAYYLDDSDSKKLWAIGAAVFITIYPWTGLVMMPGIQKAKKEDALETRGADWMERTLKAWNSQHMYRSLASLTAFGIFMYALHKH